MRTETTTNFFNLKRYRRYFPHFSDVVRILTFSDILVLSGLGLMSPVFAVFITDQVQGGSLEVAGFASTIYLIVKSLLQIPVAQYIDAHKGERDDFYFMVVGSFIGVLAVGMYLFVTNALEVYLIQIIAGIGTAVSLPAWMAIFTRHIDKNEEGIEWSVYYTVTDLGGALSAGLGGIIAGRLGFTPLFLTAAVLSFLGTLVLIPSYSKLKKR